MCEMLTNEDAERIIGERDSALLQVELLKKALEWVQVTPATEVGKIAKDALKQIPNEKRKPLFILCSGCGSQQKDCKCT